VNKIKYVIYKSKIYLLLPIIQKLLETIIEFPLIARNRKVTLVN